MESIKTLTKENLSRVLKSGEERSLERVTERIDNAESEARSLLERFYSKQVEIQQMLAEKTTLETKLSSLERFDSILIYLNNLKEAGQYVNFSLFKDCIIGETSEIVIHHEGKEYHLGFFYVFVSPKNNKIMIMPRYYDHSKMDEVFRGYSNEVRSVGFSSHFHPHVSSSSCSPCLGNISGQIPELLSSGNYGIVFEVMYQYLQSYNERSPYTKVENLANNHNYPDGKTYREWMAERRRLANNNEVVVPEVVDGIPSEVPEEVEPEVLSASDTRDLLRSTESRGLFSRMASRTDYEAATEVTLTEDYINSTYFSGTRISGRSRNANDDLRLVLRSYASREALSSLTSNDAKRIIIGLSLRRLLRIPNIQLNRINVTQIDRYKEVFFVGEWNERMERAFRSSSTRGLSNIVNRLVTRLLSDFRLTV